MTITTQTHVCSNAYTYLWHFIRGDILKFQMNFNSFEIKIGLIS